MARPKPFATPQDEYDYWLRRFIKGGPWGPVESKIRYFALRDFAFRHGIALPPLDGSGAAIPDPIPKPGMGNLVPPVPEQKPKSLLEELEERQ